MTTLIQRLRLKFLGRLDSEVTSPVPQFPSIHQLHDHVYEICRPPGRPTMELVFFHGLQRDDNFEQAHLLTWTTRGKEAELWLPWLADKFPGARILTILYDAALRTDPQPTVDMFVTSKNLLESLLHRNVRVGQVGSPVILVGHSLGGLVIKDVLLRASSQFFLEDSNFPDAKNLLDNVHGIFFFATPHLGANLPNYGQTGSLIDFLKPLNRHAARLSHKFSQLCRKYHWRTRAVGEGLQTILGNLQGYIVSEESARSADTTLAADTFYIVNADHFDVCRPENKSSSSFVRLLEFISQGSLEWRLAEEFARDILDETGEGYFVSTTWLVDLTEHDKKIVAAALLDAGYSVVYETSDVTCYEGIKVHLGNALTSAHQEEIPATSCIVAASAGPRTMRNLEGQNTPFFKVFSYAQKSDDAPHIFKSDYVPPFLEAATKNFSNWTVVDKDFREGLESPVEERELMMQSFVTTLQNKSLRVCYVSRHWFSNIDAREKAVVRLLLQEEGFVQVGETGTTLEFERPPDHVRISNVHDHVSNRTAQHNDPESSTRITDDVAMADAFPSSKNAPLIPNTLNKENASSSNDRMSVTTGTETSKKASDTCTCVPQLLQVACIASSSTSTAPVMPPPSSTTFTEYTVKEEFGHIGVNVERPRFEEYDVGTRLEKRFSIPRVAYRPGDWREEFEYVTASIGTDLSCCLTEDSPRNLRIGFAKIEGLLKSEGSTREAWWQSLILTSVRTNVIAHFYSGTRPFRIRLNLQDEHDSEHHTGAVALVHPTDAAARVSFSVSGNHPDDSEPGSITVALLNLAKRKAVVDHGETVARSRGGESGEGEDAQHTLLFHRKRKFEGILKGSLPSNPIVKFQLRHQLEVSYLKPILNSQPRPWTSGNRETMPVKYNCSLNFATSNPG